LPENSSKTIVLYTESVREELAACSDVSHSGGCEVSMGNHQFYKQKLPALDGYLFISLQALEEIARQGNHSIDDC
jgi:hypothetical protein